MANSLGETSGTWRGNFTEAIGWFLDTAAQARGRLDQPGLGEWSVRALIGHTGRAITTVTDYLGATGTPAATVLDYYRLAPSWDAAAIAQRGRDAAAALGDHPVAALAAAATPVRTAVSVAADQAPLRTPVGVMALEEYLPTRTFELTVHTCDLAVALGLPPVPPLGPATSALRILGQAAGPRLGTVLLSLTGRRQLPAGFTLLG